MDIVEKVLPIVLPIALEVILRLWKSEKKLSIFRISASLLLMIANALDKVIKDRVKE